MSANTETTGVKVGDVFERLTDIDSHRRAGSQFRIEEVDGEWAHWERRMYCLSPRSLLDETRYKRVTPPIAAPAAHVERRKGQRWRLEFLSTDGSVWSSREDTLATMDGEAWLGKDGPGFSAECWTRPKDYRMTLLADAPPEPGKPFCCDLTAFGPGGCNCKSPPAQEAPNLLNAVVKVMDAHYRRPGIEAPKAAPVCSECDHAQPNVCMRVTREARELLCDICMTRKEEQVIDLMGQEPRAVPYKGPTRLPRPQLAADWVEDCLPEGGR